MKNKQTIYCVVRNDGHACVAYEHYEDADDAKGAYEQDMEDSGITQYTFSVQGVTFYD